ncbi:MAG: hypothetical protein V4738_03165 [Pseudomonadota bacterium]
MALNIRTSLLSIAIAGLASVSAYAGSGNDAANIRDVAGSQATVATTKVKTSEQKRKEISDYVKNPVTADGFCMRGDGDMRYVGPGGKC